MEPIQVKGAELLTEQENFEANKILQAAYEKLKRKIKGEFSLRVTIKEYSNQNKDKKEMRRKYSLNAEVIGVTRLFSASSFDWDFNRALHKLVNKLYEEIEHRFHVSEQGRE